MADVGESTGSNARLNRTARITNSHLATSFLYLQDNVARSGSNRGQGESEDSIYPNPHDWQCQSITLWRDLGQFYYPRFIKQITCTQTQCYNDFFNCRTQYYPVTVLKLRDREVTDNEMGMPLQLRNMWMFESLQVSIGCMCGVWTHVVTMVIAYNIEQD